MELFKICFLYLFFQREFYLTYPLQVNKIRVETNDFENYDDLNDLSLLSPIWEQKDVLEATFEKSTDKRSFQFGDYPFNQRIINGLVSLQFSPDITQPFYSIHNLPAYLMLTINSADPFEHFDDKRRNFNFHFHRFHRWVSILHK